MTDKQKEYLYNSIVDFDLFFKSIADNSDNYGMQFEINGDTVTISNEHLSVLVSEFKEQMSSDHQHNQEEKIKAKDSELNKIDDHLYKVEHEFMDRLLYTRDIASGRLTYHELLIKLIKLLRAGIIIRYKDKTLINLDDLDSLFRSFNLHGYQDLDNELK